MKRKLKAMLNSVKYDLTILKVKVLAWKRNHPDEFWATVGVASIFILLCVL